MTQNQIIEFRENIIAIEASEKEELNHRLISAYTRFQTVVSQNVNKAKSQAEINRDKILFDQEVINVQIESAERIIAKAKEKNLHAVIFVYEQRSNLLSEITRTLEFIERLFKKELNSTYNSNKRKNSIEKRIKKEKVLAKNLKEFDNWVQNQRRINGDECLITKSLELTFFNRPNDD